MLGVNEVKNWEDLSTDTVLGLCESMLARREEADMKRMMRTDQDCYFRTMKTQFNQLDDRYPGIFNMLLQYGRTAPGGLDIMSKISDMLRKRDLIFDKMKQGMDREDAGAQEDKQVDYDLAATYLRGKIMSDEQFDSIVPKTSENDVSPPSP